MKKRLATICLIMQGYMGLQVAQLLNLHRQLISSYVQKFNEGGIDALLEQRYAPGKKPYLSEEEEVQLKNIILEFTSVQEGFGVEAYWNTHILQYVLEEKFNASMTRFESQKCFIVGNEVIHAPRACEPSETTRISRKSSRVKKTPIKT
jgi:transposase